MDFSLSEKRLEQDQIMENVTDCLQKSEHQLITAPTGVGKTAATLFPSIKYAVQHQKRIVYLTSKTTQQEIIRETLKPIINEGLDLIIVFLRSRKNMCANDVVFCHEDYCPYVKNYQDDKIKSAVISRLQKKKMITADDIYSCAKDENTCPAEIMIDVAVTCDILVGDYNYLFDPRVRLNRVFHQNDLSDWILIIDEAHNLYQRIIDALSPELKRSSLNNLKKAFLNKKLKVYQSLKSSLTAIETLFQSLQEEGELHYSEQQYFTFNPDLTLWQEIFRDYEHAFMKYLMFKIKKNMILIEDPFEELYYQFRGLVQVAWFQDDAFITIYNAASRGLIKIVCCDPSRYINDMITKFHSATAMSATLDPIDFYREILGFPPDNTRLLEVSSPFSSKNRQIIILPTISTYYRDRAVLYKEYSDIVMETISHKAGNYVVFCPSFEFLQHVSLFLGKVKADIIVQRRQMDKQDRDEILAQMKDSTKPKLLLAVMGGIFSEGVDFKGDMCIGVIIFSPALPPVTYERELIKIYYDHKNGNGFNYAYLYPGINKVIQSVGRLIRSQQDRGIIVLAGERFARDEINQLFPEYWFEKEGDVVITEDLEETITSFWKRFD